MAGEIDTLQLESLIDALKKNSEDLESFIRNGRAGSESEKFAKISPADIAKLSEKIAEAISKLDLTKSKVSQPGIDQDAIKDISDVISQGLEDFRSQFEYNFPARGAFNDKGVDNMTKLLEGISQSVSSPSQNIRGVNDADATADRIRNNMAGGLGSEEVDVKDLSEAVSDLKDTIKELAENSKDDSGSDSTSSGTPGGVQESQAVLGEINDGIRSLIEVTRESLGVQREENKGSASAYDRTKGLDEANKKSQVDSNSRMGQQADVNTKNIVNKELLKFFTQPDQSMFFKKLKGALEDIKDGFSKLKVSLSKDYVGDFLSFLATPLKIAAGVGIGLVGLAGVGHAMDFFKNDPRGQRIAHTISVSVERIKERLQPVLTWIKEKAQAFLESAVKWISDGLYAFFKEADWKTIGTIIGPALMMGIGTLSTGSFGIRAGINASIALLGNLVPLLFKSGALSFLAKVASGFAKFLPGIGLGIAVAFMAHKGIQALVAMAQSSPEFQLGMVNRSSNVLGAYADLQNWEQSWMSHIPIFGPLASLVKTNHVILAQASNVLAPLAHYAQIASRNEAVREISKTDGILSAIKNGRSYEGLDDADMATLRAARQGAHTQFSQYNTYDKMAEFLQGTALGSQMTQDKAFMDLLERKGGLRDAMADTATRNEIINRITDKSMADALHRVMVDSSWKDGNKFWMDLGRGWERTNYEVGARGGTDVKEALISAVGKNVAYGFDVDLRAAMFEKYRSDPSLYRGLESLFVRPSGVPESSTEISSRHFQKIGDLLTPLLLGKGSSAWLSAFMEKGSFKGDTPEEKGQSLVRALGGMLGRDPLQDNIIIPALRSGRLRQLGFNVDSEGNAPVGSADKAKIEQLDRLFEELNADRGKNAQSSALAALLDNLTVDEEYIKRIGAEHQLSGRSTEQIMSLLGIDINTPKGAEFAAEWERENEEYKRKVLETIAESSQKTAENTDPNNGPPMESGLATHLATTMWGRMAHSNFFGWGQYRQKVDAGEQEALNLTGEGGALENFKSSGDPGKVVNWFLDKQMQATLVAAGVTDAAISAIADKAPEVDLGGAVNGIKDLLQRILDFWTGQGNGGTGAPALPDAAPPGPNG